MEVVRENNASIALVRFNRPEKMNALNLDTLKLLEHTLLEIQDDDTCRGVIITGNGKAFSAGGDINDMRSRLGKGLKTKNRLDRWLNSTAKRIRDMKKPMIAAVNGACFGAGLVIATACDVIYASEKAKFGFAHGNVGLIPEGAYFLTRFMGLQRAKDLVFSRKVISAADAMSYGLVLETFDADLLLESSIQKMKEWVEGPIHTIGLAKEVLNKAYEVNYDSYIGFESLAQGAAFTTEEHKEGVDAFFERRKPVFLDKGD